MAPKVAANALKEEPQLKKARTEEPNQKERKKDESKENVEIEKDAPHDARPSVKESITFDPMNTTLNVLPTCEGKVLMSCSEGGLQFFIAGARANVGVKAGRYMFEAKVVEALNPIDNAGNRGKVPLPRQILRVGFSLAGSSLILGEDEDSVCFDAEGHYIAEKKKTIGVTDRISRDQTIAIVLNLDETSQNYRSVSLFRNGQRMSEPQKLPEAFNGKTLYPHVSYRNISVQVNFDAVPLFPLPFKCRSLATAAAADVEVLKPELPKDGRYEVMFPVAFPDEGTFDWLDTFLEKNPHYVELSDRKIVEWGAKSGLMKPKSAKNSGDRPDFNYGLPAMDDRSIRKVLNVVAPLVPRNYVVMEVKENLTEIDRRANLRRFSDPIYKKVARVVMGEPIDDYKRVIQTKILKEKKEKVLREWKQKKAEEDRKKQLAARQKQLAAQQKAAAEKRKKAEEAKKVKAAEEAKERANAAAKKKAEAEAKKKQEAGGLDGDAEEEADKEPPMDAEAQKEVTEEEAGKNQEKEVEDKQEVENKVEEEEDEGRGKDGVDDEIGDDAPPEVELDEEDTKIWFLPQADKDLAPEVLSQAFSKFTIPKNSEGFDEILYEWQGAEEANDYLRRWVLNRKLTCPNEHLEPSDWFKERHTTFTKTFKEWAEKQKPFVAQKLALKKAAEKKAANGEDVIDEDLRTDDVDIFAVTDACDVGNGEPLFVNFALEDWVLLTLRCELVLLVHAFKHDINDEDYIGIQESHLAFYYNKYFQKQLVLKHYGRENNAGLIELVKDCVTIDKETNVLTTSLEEQNALFESEVGLIFLKLTEESRRERQRRADAGDETAKLKFSPLLKTAPLKSAAAQAAKSNAKKKWSW